MTWAEFQIRAFAYERMELKKWQKVRKIAYSALIAPYQKPRSIPKSEKAFMPLKIDKKTQGISEEAKIRYLEATKEYLKIKNGIKRSNRG